MIAGKTNSGFEFELADSIFEDYEVTEALCEYLDSKSYYNFVKLKKKMFKGSEDCEKRALDFLKNDDGTVTNAEMIRLVFDIWNSAKALKNS